VVNPITIQIQKYTIFYKKNFFFSEKLPNAQNRLHFGGECKTLIIL